MEIGLTKKMEEMRHVTWFLTQGPGAGAPPAQDVKDGGPIGYRLFSEDERKVLQMRKDGFTFSQLQPYDNWEAFFSEGSRLWRLYAAMAHPEDISRIALRYINRFSVPMTRLPHCLTAFPALPEGMPPYVSQWMTRVLIHEPEIGTNAFLTQVAEAPQADKIPMLLDIEAFIEGRLPLDPEQLLTRFLALHDLKNRLFFESFTEEGLQLFQ
jgi:uncharacterized protein (TIGR04255 family)